MIWSPTTSDCAAPKLSKTAVIHSGMPGMLALATPQQAASTPFTPACACLLYTSLLATAYWAWDVTLMRQMALATGRTGEAEKYAGLFEKIRAAFEKQFVRGDGFVAGADNSPSQFGVINNPNAKSEGGDTQTGYVLALHMNLLPAALRAAAAKRLVAKIEDNHNLLATGFLGTPYLLEELTKAGYTKLAYTLLLNTQYPSWRCV